MEAVAPLKETLTDVLKSMGKGSRGAAPTTTVLLVDGFSGLRAFIRDILPQGTRFLVEGQQAPDGEVIDALVVESGVSEARVAQAYRWLRPGGTMSRLSFKSDGKGGGEAKAERHSVKGLVEGHLSPPPPSTPPHDLSERALDRLARTIESAVFDQTARESNADRDTSDARGRMRYQIVEAIERAQAEQRLYFVEGPVNAAGATWAEMQEVAALEDAVVVAAWTAPTDQVVSGHEVYAGERVVLASQMNGTIYYVKTGTCAFRRELPMSAPLLAQLTEDDLMVGAAYVTPVPGPDADWLRVPPAHVSRRTDGTLWLNLGDRSASPVIDAEASRIFEVYFPRARQRSGPATGWKKIEPGEVSFTVETPGISAEELTSLFPSGTKVLESWVAQAPSNCRGYVVDPGMAVLVAKLPNGQERVVLRNGERTVVVDPIDIARGGAAAVASVVEPDLLEVIGIALVGLHTAVDVHDADDQVLSNVEAGLQALGYDPDELRKAAVRQPSATDGDDLPRAGGPVHISRVISSTFGGPTSIALSLVETERTACVAEIDKEAAIAANNPGGALAVKHLGWAKKHILERGAGATAPTTTDDPKPRVAVLLAEPWGDKRAYIAGLFSEGMSFLAPGEREKNPGRSRFDVLLVEMGCSRARLAAVRPRLVAGGFELHVRFSPVGGVAVAGEPRASRNNLRLSTAHLVDLGDEVERRAVGHTEIEDEHLRVAAKLIALVTDNQAGDSAPHAPELKRLSVTLARSPDRTPRVLVLLSKPVDGERHAIVGMFTPGTTFLESSVSIINTVREGNGPYDVLVVETGTSHQRVIDARQLLLPLGFEAHVVFTTTGATLCARANKQHLSKAPRPRVAVMLKAERTPGVNVTVASYDDLWDAKVYNYGRSVEDLHDVALVEQEVPIGAVGRSCIVEKSRTQFATIDFCVFISRGSGGGLRLS
jgi:hypothetical protein